ncbi:uncharacterized protein LOC126785517 isoform X2 [Argentina anserina]|uniref:uncharacterized protein LOC126785517 isoform X2 n=1 Tax=Argentina anserina TaxID=57926 RepID=UPI0021763F7E|nr:uncharacterized protein LOC126785517 isoform X2 [Potentilla anserina]
MAVDIYVVITYTNMFVFLWCSVQIYVENRVKGPDVPFEPMKLLWLIQREFLEGKSVEQVVHDALLTVPNHNGNKNIEMVNQIRDSISIMGYNITAFSLPQPHLQRSKLCDMLDDELDPTYIKNMGQLIPFVANMIRLKTLQGQPLHGKEFLSLLDQILEVANHVEIPSTGSQMDLFNHMVVEQCLQLYVQKMAGLHLPIGQHEIQGLHRSSIDEARQCSVNHYLGGGFQTTKVLLKLEEEIQKIYRYLIVDNECQSAKLCEGIYKRCIDVFDKITLPSLKKITEVSKQCNIDFEQQCIGPAKNYYEQRVKKLLERSSALARRIYDERLHCIWIAVGVLLLVMVTVAGARVYWRKKMMRSELELLPVHRPLHRD